MKIAFLTGNLRNGGAQRVVSVLANGISKKGHTVSLLTFAKHEAEYPIADDVELVYMKQSEDEYDQYPLLLRLRDVRVFLKKQKPDVAVGFMEAGYALFLASRGLGVKCIGSIRNHPERLMERKDFRAVLTRMWFRHADAVVLQTKRQADYVKDLGWKNCAVIPNPIPESISCYSHSAAVREGNATLKIMMAGRLVQQKNYPIALQAFHKLAEDGVDFTADIYGEGKEEKKLRELIESLQLSEKVTLRGWIPNVVEEMCRHHIYILSSDYEGMPNSLMEALGVGMVCISTDCFSGPAEMIDHGVNGFLVPVGDHDGLYKTLVQVSRMEEQELKSISENAKRRIAEDYNEMHIVEMWEKLFQSC